MPALPTPLTEEGRLDEKGLEKLVKHVLAGGVHGLWVLGSTAEFPSLDEQERRTIVEICIREAHDRVPLVVGVGDLDLRKLVRNAEQASKAGAHACFATLPYYYALDLDEAVRYLREVAGMVPLPFVFYDNPFSTNVKFDVKTILEIVELPNLIAIKDSAGDFRRFLEAANSLPENAPGSLLQGLDQLVGPSLLLGGSVGAVLALASVMPTLFVQLYEAATTGNIAQFKDLQRRVLWLCRLYEVKGAATDGAFFAGVKAALEVLGVCGRNVAHPFSAMPASKMPEVEAVLARCQPQSHEATSW
jgi:4-hydroxy-tetrahydrodipicolinate synthase